MKGDGEVEYHAYVGTPVTWRTLGVYMARWAATMVKEEYYDLDIWLIRRAKHPMAPTLEELHASDAIIWHQTVALEELIIDDICPPWDAYPLLPLMQTRGNKVLVVKVQAQPQQQGMYTYAHEMCVE
jgi:hypothetical protein